MVIKEVWSPYSSLLVHLDLFDLVGVVMNRPSHEPIMDRIPIMKLQVSSWYTSYSSARTEALLKSSSEIILWHLNMLLKEGVDMEN